MGERSILKNNDLFLAKTRGNAYRVAEGALLVFIVSVKNDICGRRFLLFEAKEGDVIPSLAHRDCAAPEGETAEWAFLLSPMGQCTIETVQDSEEIRTAFAQKAGLRGCDELGFEESAAEHYRLCMAKDLRNVYAANTRREAAYRESLEAIYDLFQKDAIRRKGKLPQRTGNALYDAAALLCAWQKIDAVSFDILMANCGKKFTVKDMARLSGFVCRDIMLEENWFKKDAGPVLAYDAVTGNPVVCFPKGRSHYILWDPSDDSVSPLSAELAARLKPQAQMFYRPFPKQKMSMKSIMRFVLKDLCVSDVANVLAFTLLGTMIGLLMPLLNEQIYDVFIPTGDKRGLFDVCMVVLACSVGNISFSIVKNFANFRFLSRMKYAVQAAVIDRLFNLPESFYRGKESADLGDRAMGISQVFSMLTSTLMGVGLTAVFSIVYLIRMFGYSAELGWTSVLMLLPAMLIVLLFGWLQIRHEKKRLELGGEISSTIFQLISGVSKLRMAGAEDHALYEYMRRYTEACSINMRLQKYSLAGGIVNGGVSTVFSVVLYYMMVHHNLNLSVGAFMGFATAFGAFSGAMMQVVSAYLQFNAIGPALERMKPILETLPEQATDTAMPGDISGDIEISNVTFAYDQDAPAVIKDVSVHIRPGEYVGIVGSSGCGKSTLLKLLLGFEKPREGRIYYDSKDIDTVDKRELRKKFGVVLQDGGLITGSIYDNITITTPGATMNEVKAAVKAAGLERDIAEMPMGLHTLLSEGDGSISGGQRQRVLIARAIVGKPKVIYFDEATSALDNATQAAVCESLEQLDSTRVVIAHRLSTIMKCDRILVMDQGEIVEEGTYEQLMEKKGRFFQLASRQIS